MRPAAAAVLALAILWQVLAASWYRMGPVSPDFILLAVSYIALFERPRRAVSFALVAGVLADLASADPWGAHALSYAVPAWALGLAGRAGWGDDHLARAGLAAVASSLAGGARDAFLAVAEPAARGPAWPLVADALYAAALAPVVFALLDPIRGSLFPQTRSLVV